MVPKLHTHSQRRSDQLMKKSSSLYQKDIQRYRNTEKINIERIIYKLDVYVKYREKYREKYSEEHREKYRNI